jgi:hypothetical protein
MHNSLIIAIDFDGTICETDFPSIGLMKPRADLYINKLFDEGNQIIINTCRSGIHEGNAQVFLDVVGIKYHYINSNLPHMIEQYGQDCRKISADIYIDDRCLMGIPETWKEIYELVQLRKLSILNNR